MSCKKTYIIYLLIIFIIISLPVNAILLRKDDQGPDVKHVQILLKELGYDILADGYFGLQTRRVVKEFQKSNGLLVDGIVGDSTYQAIEDRTKEIKYTVESGDSLSYLALKFDSSIKIIKERNNLKSDFIKIGQTLYIPNTGIGGGEEEGLYEPIVHEIESGEVLSVLAIKYGVDVDTIRMANELSNNTIYSGQTLVIPHIRYGKEGSFDLTKGAIIWPVLGRITSGYGTRIHPILDKKHFHGGIDISVPTGSKVRAAASGTVIQSGNYNGYGKTIVIDHGSGVDTLYAHNSKLLVRTGDKVNMGQVIALSGSTGLSTGPHLDFRIIVNDKTVNPLNYLP